MTGIERLTNDPTVNLRHQLLCRIGRRYHVVTEDVRFGSLSFPFTRIANPDRVLDEVAAEADLRDRLQGHQSPGDELHLPYWAELWESARGIGEFLISAECRVQSAELRPDDAQPVKVSLPFCTLHSELCTSSPNAECRVQSAELRPDDAQPVKVSLPFCTLHSEHCTSSPSPSPPSVLDLGCGMGMAGTVAAALGAKVVFADLEAPALLFAQLNSLPWRRRARTRRLNWQRDRLNEKFDLILGADILYERAQWTWLDTFWRAHLVAGGRVILGEPGRQTGDLFIEWIVSKGWSLTMSEVPVAGRPRPIRIFIIS